jgi:hypothetical protein
MSRPLYVQDFPEDLHGYLEDQVRPQGAPSKRVALIELLRAARERGLSVGMAVSERTDT